MTIIKAIIFINLFLISSCGIKQGEVKKHIAWNIKHKKVKETTNYKKSIFRELGIKFSKNMQIPSHSNSVINFNINNPNYRNVNGAIFLILKEKIKLNDLIYDLKTIKLEAMDIYASQIEGNYRVSKNLIHINFNKKGVYQYIYHNIITNDIETGTILFV